MYTYTPYFHTIHLGKKGGSLYTWGTLMGYHLFTRVEGAGLTQAQDGEKRGGGGLNFLAGCTQQGGGGSLRCVLSAQRGVGGSTHR